MGSGRVRRAVAGAFVAGQALVAAAFLLAPTFIVWSGMEASYTFRVLPTYALAALTGASAWGIWTRRAWGVPLAGAAVGLLLVGWVRFWFYLGTLSTRSFTDFLVDPWTALFLVGTATAPLALVLLVPDFDRDRLADLVRPEVAGGFVALVGVGFAVVGVGAALAVASAPADAQLAVTGLAALGVAAAAVSALAAVDLSRGVRWAWAPALALAGIAIATRPAVDHLLPVTDVVRGAFRAGVYVGLSVDPVHGLWTAALLLLPGTRRALGIGGPGVTDRQSASGA